MVRFFVTVIVGLGLCGAVAWYFGWLPESISAPMEDNKNKVDSARVQDYDFGDPLTFRVEAIPSPSPEDYVPKREDWIVIPGHLEVMDKQEVFSEVDGLLLFVGEQVPDEVVCGAGLASFSAEPFLNKKINRGDQDLIVIYRRLYPGHIVGPDQMVGMINPAKALNELGSRHAKTKAAEAEWKASEALLEESEKQLASAKRLRDRNTDVISRDEYGMKEATRNKYKEETVSKKYQIKVAEEEEDAARTNLKYHSIRNHIRSQKSIIKDIFRVGGEQVKNQQESIMHLYTTDRVKVEAMVPIQNLSRLIQDMKVIIEPTREEGPFKTFRAHTGDITSVAISKDNRIVSGSEDKYVCVWTQEKSEPVQMLSHNDPVRAVACSPKRNLCLAGCANGSIYLWDLDRKDREPIVIIQAAAGNEPITALAFSPDGAWFASGGEDNIIRLWKTEDCKEPGCEPAYSFEPKYGVDHQPEGTITSLAFTPQAQLVSASRDNTLRVWALHKNGARLVVDPIEGRGGNVTQLGVSSDGRWMLFDQTKTLQVRSVADGLPRSFLQDPAGSTPFATLALFSPDPDASLILTGGAPEGRLKLWRTPTSSSPRGYEVRQLVTMEKFPVTCAAFSAEAGQVADRGRSFAVSGTRDGIVYLWSVPTKDDIKRHQIKGARLTMIGQAVEPGARQVRVAVELDNRDGRLVIGRPANIVIEP